MHQGRQDPKSRPLVGLLAVLLLAACSGGGTKAALTTTTSTESSSSPTTTQPRSAADADWVGQGLRPISQLVGAGGRIIYLGVDDQGLLQLIGLDPRTGAVVWHRPSTAATHIPGVEQHLVADGDTVFNVEPSGAANSRVAFPAQAVAAFDVVAVDAHTGRDLWRHPFDDVSTPLDACGKGLCVQVDTPGRHLGITRLTFATGDILSEGSKPFEPLVAEDGELAISAARDSDEIVLTDGFGQHVVWQHTRTELFGPSAVTPDDGWSGLHLNGVWVVWIGADWPSLGATSGISDDGQVLWTRPDIVPCFPFTDDPMTVPVVCGQVDEATHPVNIGTIEGVDPQTGTALWSLAVGAVDAVKPSPNVVRLLDTHFAIHLASGDVSIDTTTGPLDTTVPLDGWCQTADDEVLVEGRQSAVSRSWAPCTLGVGPNHTPPKIVPAFAGPTVNGFFAWVEDGEVRAAKVS